MLTQRAAWDADGTAAHDGVATGKFGAERGFQPDGEREELVRVQPGGVIGGQWEGSSQDTGMDAGSLSVGERIRQEMYANLVVL